MFCGPTRPRAARRPPFVREQVPAREHRLPRRWRIRVSWIGRREPSLSCWRRHLLMAFAWLPLSRKQQCHRTAAQERRSWLVASTSSSPVVAAGGALKSVRP